MFVAANLDQAVGPGDMAALVGLSAGAFHRSFKASFGVTPYAFVLNARLKHSLSLLERSSASLRDVAAASGFFDQAHLCNAFRRRHGMAPNRWRELHGTPGGPTLAALPHSPDFDAVTPPPMFVSSRKTS